MYYYIFISFIFLLPFIYQAISDPHFIPREVSSGHTPHYYLINTWLCKRQILQGIRDTLQGLRKYKVCKTSFVWLRWQLFDNMVLFANNCQNDYDKQVLFKCSQKPQIRGY